MGAFPAKRSDEARLKWNRLAHMNTVISAASRIVNLVEGVISAVISAERVKRHGTISRAMSSHAEERLRKMSQSIKRLCPVHDV